MADNEQALRMAVPLALTISIWGNAAASEPEELAPFIKAIGAFWQRDDFRNDDPGGKTIS